MKKNIIYIALVPYDFICLIYGIIFYGFYKKTPNVSYRAMHRLFYIFGGSITDFINFFTKSRINKKNHQSQSESKLISNLIKSDGLFLKKNFLSEDELIAIKNLIFNYNFRLRPTDHNLKNNKNVIKEEKFNSLVPKAVLYEVDKDYLINQKIIQKIIVKKEILDIGKEYFGSNPFFDHVSLSISTDFNKNQKPDSMAAQLYHFDLDRPKWLKFLIYINDVNLYNGPHCFIKETHKNNAIPFSIRSRGYVRIDDNDLEMKQLKKKELVLTGEAGTAIIEDTKGLHKGLILQKGYRILLNIQINSSMFGTPYKRAYIKKISSDLQNEYMKHKFFFKYSTNIDDVV